MIYKNYILSIVFILFSWILSPSGICLAQSGVEGFWLSSNDETGKPVAIVRLVEKDGELKGFVEKIVAIGHENDLCEKCAGHNQNIRIQGMQFLGNMKRTDGIWTNGWVIDSENGNTYSAKAQLVESGAKLKLEGFIGLPIFGRTKYFSRLDKADLSSK